MDTKEAVQKLGDVDKAVRDAAMAALLSAASRAIPDLVDALANPAAPIAKIVLLLAALNARDALPRLYELLARDGVGESERAVIARALGELLDGRDAFDDGAKQAILKLSQDGDVTVRQLSVRALSKVGDLECEERLSALASSDRDEATKKLARDAVATLRANRGSDVDAHAPVDLAALVAQSQSSPAAVDDAPSGPFAPLILRLRDPRWTQKAAAVEEAVQLGKRAVPALIEVLQGTHAGAKIGAAQAIARIAPSVGAPEAVQPLFETVLAPLSSGAASDDEKALRPIALKALACTLTGGEEGLAQPLLPLTKDADPFVRAGALLCLGRLADRIGARAATLALNDPHEHVREAAAVALSEGTREEDQDLVLPLLAILGGMPSPQTAVREAILLALARITIDVDSVDGAATLVRLRHRVRPSIFGITASLRRTAIGILERCYSDDDPAPIGVVDDVLGRLADDHPEVRLLAASFLARHLEPGLTGAVEIIEDALDRAERPVSLLVLEALKRHATGKAKLALQAAAEDPDDVVAARAQELLDGFTPAIPEWSATKGAAVDAAAPVSAGAATPVVPVEQRPRRTRPARAAPDPDGDVVEAKDPAEDKAPSDMKDNEGKQP